MTTPADHTQEEGRYAQAAEIFRMRKLGMSIADIADHLDLSDRDVAQTLRSALRRAFVEDVQDLRVLTAQRYDLLLSAWLPLALNISGDVGPDQQAKAADITCRVLAALRTMFGVDAPKRVLVAGQATVDLDAAWLELQKEARRGGHAPPALPAAG